MKEVQQIYLPYDRFIATVVVVTAAVLFIASDLLDCRNVIYLSLRVKTQSVYVCLLIGLNEDYCRTL